VTCTEQDDEGADEATDCEDEGPEPAQAEEKRLRKEREAADAEEEARAIKVLKCSHRSHSLVVAENQCEETSHTNLSIRVTKKTSFSTLG
jgi:hypothetical protein